MSFRSLTAIVLGMAFIACENPDTGRMEGQDEGKRLGRVLGNRSIMMMANHGVLIAAPTVAEAWEHMYFLERAQFVVQPV